MDKSNERNPTPQQSEDKAPSRESQRRITVSLLATSVALTLSNWDAMAHGNRSSHKSAAGFSWAPDRYILMRQELEDPQNPDTRSLRDLYNRLDNLSVPGATPTDPAEPQQIRDKIKSLEDKLRLTPLSGQVFILSKQGDTAGVAALLEGSGNTEAVLDAYNWTLLDIARRNDQGLLTTDTDLDAVVTVSHSARTYVERLQTSLTKNKEYPDRMVVQSKVAALLHNIGSLTIPDIGQPTQASLTVGRDAAKAELKLREELGDPLDTLRAQLVVGQQLTKSGDLEQASSVLTRAKLDADKLGHKSLQAFSRAYLADLADARKNPDAASRLRFESRSLLDVQTQAAAPGRPRSGGMRPFSVERLAKELPDQQELRQREQRLNDADYLRAYLARK